MKLRYELSAQFLFKKNNFFPFNEELESKTINPPKKYTVLMVANEKKKKSVRWPTREMNKKPFAK